LFQAADVSAAVTSGTNDKQDHGLLEPMLFVFIPEKNKNGATHQRQLALDVKELTGTLECVMRYRACVAATVFKHGAGVYPLS
jgi:hypothetical protein